MDSKRVPWDSRCDICGKLYWEHLYIGMSIQQEKIPPDVWGNKVRVHAFPRYRLCSGDTVELERREESCTPTYSSLTS